jgi:hypothetical protein
MAWLTCNTHTHTHTPEDDFPRAAQREDLLKELNNAIHILVVACSSALPQKPSHAHAGGAGGTVSNGGAGAAGTTTIATEATAQAGRGGGKVGNGVIGGDEAGVRELVAAMDAIWSFRLRDIALFGRTSFWDFAKNLTDCLPAGMSCCDAHHHGWRWCAWYD